MVVVHLLMCCYHYSFCCINFHFKWSDEQKNITAQKIRREVKSPEVIIICGCAFLLWLHYVL